MIRHAAHSFYVPCAKGPALACLLAFRHMSFLTTGRPNLVLVVDAGGCSELLLVADGNISFEEENFFQV
jgi:hypothetical protein